jgi:hypothetical protein
VPPWTEVARPAPGQSSHAPPQTKVSRASPSQSSPAPAPGWSSPVPLLLGARPRCPGGAQPRRPLAEVARAAPAHSGGRSCRPGRSSTAPTLLAACPRWPGSELPPPSTSRHVHSRIPQCLDEARRRRSCLKPAHAALEELVHAGPWWRSPTPPQTELNRASPAWSLPASASVGAPFSVHISSCPQSDWRPACGLHQ